jgi:putative ABC transport system permease protein
MYQAVRDDPRIDLAVPYAVGDNYRGFRIVGTTLDLFTEVELAAGRGLAVEAGGRLFEPLAREAVVGSFAAQRLGLRIGDSFNPYHGIAFDESKRHLEEYSVVGVLRPSNTPADRVIWIPIEGIYRMSGHVLRGSGDSYRPEEGAAIPDEHKEVSAVMLRFASPQTGFLLDQTINKQGKVATLAFPIGAVMADFFGKLGWMHRVLTLVAYLVVLVAAGSILASIYNTMNERRRELAILRALGARRRTVFSAIVLEAAAVGGLGTLVGFGVYLAIFAAAAAIIRAQTGVVLELTAFHPVLLWGPAAVVCLAAAAGVVPAVKAYATDVADGLTPRS